MDINILLGVLKEDQERAQRNIKIYAKEIAKIEDEARKTRLLAALKELELEEQKMSSLIVTYEELLKEQGIDIISSDVSSDTAGTP